MRLQHGTWWPDHDCEIRQGMRMRSKVGEVFIGGKFYGTADSYIPRGTSVDEMDLTDLSEIECAWIGWHQIAVYEDWPKPEHEAFFAPRRHLSVMRNWYARRHRAITRQPEQLELAL